MICQRYVIYVHLNLVIRISIKLTITYIWVFALIGMDHLLKLKMVLHYKASKVMYSLIQKGRRLNLPTGVVLKLFEKCVEPLYG